MFPGHESHFQYVQVELSNNRMVSANDMVHPNHHTR